MFPVKLNPEYVLGCCILFKIHFFSSCLLLVYKNVINFCILTLYYIILLVLVAVLKMP